MGYRFAVCDDNADYAEYIEALAVRWARQAGTQLETERFPSAEAFLFRYEERRDFDVLLLDIEMTGMDGVELARTVRRDNDDVQIVFITGYTDYIAEGYCSSRTAASPRRAPTRSCWPWAGGMPTCSTFRANTIPNRTVPLSPARRAGESGTRKGD